MALKITVLALYAVLVVVVGVVGSRKTRTFNDFMLGGGAVGPWMSAFSYGTAYFSAVLFIGFAGKLGWSFGFSSLWLALGNALIGTLLVWWLIGDRIRSYAEKHRIHTMPEFLEKRYDSPFLKFFSSLATFLFFIPYSAAVFMGLSYLFTSTFDIRFEYILLFMGVFTAVYLALGGYKSMAFIDVIFGMIMTVGVVALVFTCVGKAGGLAAVVDRMKAIDPRLVSPVGPPGIIPLISLVILISVPPLAMPQLVQKFYAIRDRRSIRIGMFASTFFALVVAGIAYFTGSLTRLFVTPRTNPEVFSANAAGKVLPNYDMLMPELLSNVVSEGLSVLILLLILAASMSTLAALVLISSSAVSKDIYAGFIAKNPDDRRLTLLMRASSVSFILLAMALAYFKPAFIVTILVISWGAIASVFLGPFLWGLFAGNRFANRAGAVAGSVGGLAVCLALFALMGRAQVPLAGCLGMLASVVLVPLFSLLSGGGNRVATASAAQND